MTETTYTHLTASEHYLQAQVLLAEAQASNAAPEHVALYLQAAQVHATLATARCAPLFETHHGPVSVSDHDISLFRQELPMMGYRPEQWKMSAVERTNGQSPTS